MQALEAENRRPVPASQRSDVQATAFPVLNTRMKGGNWQEAMFHAADTIEKAETAVGAETASQPCCVLLCVLCNGGRVVSQKGGRVGDGKDIWSLPDSN